MTVSVAKSERGFGSLPARWEQAMPQKYESLDQLFDAEARERRAYLDTPEGSAGFDRAMDKMRVERERFEALPAPTPYEEGQNAALRGDDRDAPAELDANQREQWLLGWDAEAPDEDDADS